MSILSITKTLIKSMFHGPYTTKYPLQEKDDFENTRGRIKIDMPNCIYCCMCERRCPTSAIKVQKVDKKWSIDRFSCIQCGYCVEVCPKKCLIMDSHYATVSEEKSREDFFGE